MTRRAIRVRREATGLSQEAFGDKIGVNRAYYGDIERGTRNVTIRNLERVARGLGTNLGVEFYGGRNHRGRYAQASKEQRSIDEPRQGPLTCLMCLRKSCRLVQARVLSLWATGTAARVHMGRFRIVATIRA